MAAGSVPTFLNSAVQTSSNLKRSGRRWQPTGNQMGLRSSLNPSLIIGRGDEGKALFFSEMSFSQWSVGVQGLLNCWGWNKNIYFPTIFDVSDPSTIRHYVHAHCRNIFVGHLCWVFLNLSEILKIDFADIYSQATRVFSKPLGGKA